MQFSRIGVSPVAHVLFVDGFTQMKMGFITRKTIASSGMTSRRTSHAFLQELKSRSESSCTIAILYGWKWRSSWRFLLTEQLESPKADACFAQNAWWSQHWSSHCLNVLRWSNGLRDSSSSSCHTSSLSECSDPHNNWFAVRDRGQRGLIKAIPIGALGCDHITSTSKVGLNSKRMLLTVPTHDGDWTVSGQNFIVLPLKRDH